MRILYITSLSGKRINSFMLSAIEAAHKMGFSFDLCCNCENASPEYENDCKTRGIGLLNVPFSRNPYNPVNIDAFKKVEKILDQGKYDLVHCNTPIGGVVGRLACKKKHINNVIYMAHGFHFWKGAPLKNWIIYYPIEKWLSKYTKTLITINQEDFEFAKKHFSKIKSINYVHGVGTETNISPKIRISKEQQEQLKRKLQIPNDSTIFICVGELNKNKNQKTILKAMAQMKEQQSICLFCGEGKMHKHYLKLAKRYHLEKRALFLGFRSDIPALLQISDVFVFSSRHEGLPASLMEAMSFGLPCIVSNIRGNADLISDRKGGILFDPLDAKGLSKSMDELCKNSLLRSYFGNENLLKIKEFDISVSVEEIAKIYSKFSK